MDLLITIIICLIGYVQLTAILMPSLQLHRAVIHRDLSYLIHRRHLFDSILLFLPWLPQIQPGRSLLCGSNKMYPRAAEPYYHHGLTIREWSGIYNI